MTSTEMRGFFDEVQGVAQPTPPAPPTTTIAAAAAGEAKSETKSEAKSEAVGTAEGEAGRAADEGAAVGSDSHDGMAGGAPVSATSPEIDAGASSTTEIAIGDGGVEQLALQPNFFQNILVLVSVVIED